MEWLDGVKGPEWGGVPGRLLPYGSLSGNVCSKE